PPLRGRAGARPRPGVTLRLPCELFERPPWDPPPATQPHRRQPPVADQAMSVPRGQRERVRGRHDVDEEAFVGCCWRSLTHTGTMPVCRRYLTVCYVSVTWLLLNCVSPFFRPGGCRTR